MSQWLGREFPREGLEIAKRHASWPILVAGALSTLFPERCHRVGVQSRAQVSISDLYLDNIAVRTPRRPPTHVQYPRML
ncbi:hypothetical protein CC2G_008814 [Coprinopsis cinerea AmutBmut pab1-1]|nr:hypothetical protein CC2G_008814 [Coprinopsis cinerea AmutBmut pab1-1]